MPIGAPGAGVAKDPAMKLDHNCHKHGWQLNMFPTNSKHACTLQIQNQSFSRVCSNTGGLHTKPEVFQNLIIFGDFLLFWIARSSPACWCGLFPVKIQWNLHHLNPYRKYGLVRVKYGFNIRVQYRFEKPEVFAKTQGFSQKYYGLLRVEYGFGANPNFSPSYMIN